MPFEAYDAALISAFVAFVGLFITAMINGKLPSGNRKKRKDFLFGAIACVLVLVALCILGRIKRFPSSILGIGKDDGTSVSDEISDSVSQTVTVAPTSTSTPVPTSTSTPIPTNTPVPTNTPPPKPTKTPTLELTETPTPTYTPTPIDAPTSTPIDPPTPGLTQSITPAPTESVSSPTPTIVSESEITVGSYMSFGAYEQDGNISNGKEIIEWLVLDVQKGKVLLISKYALDCKPYHRSYVDRTWETSTLREWLNDAFYKSAFSKEERNKVLVTEVSADENERFNEEVTAGESTQDKVFLLSILEKERYFTDDELARCAITEHSRSQGCLESDSSGTTEDGEKTCMWWLRTPGSEQKSAAVVSCGGWVYEGGRVISQDNVGVRPVIWISIE